MEYTKRKRTTVKQENLELLKNYPHDIQFYKVPPTGQLSLKEFQDEGLERRQILQLVESTTQRAELKSVEEKKDFLYKALKKDGLLHAARLLNGHGCSTHSDADLQARKRDHVSHFILRLAYCQNQELRRWFVNMEVEYLKLRLTSLNKEGIVKLMALNNLAFEMVSEKEKKNYEHNLNVSTPKVSSVESIDFYKVPYERVFDLVRSRRVWLHKGFAYTPISEFVSFFVSDFKVFLTKELEIAASNLKYLEDDHRLSSYLKSLPNVFSGMTKEVWSSAEIPIESLDELSKISYPLCMRVLHETLKTEHHLRNGGRMQYGLFIKGIGVTLEDSLRFWRTEFTKSIDLEKFEKNYAYNIRHCYGKEGKRTNYTPYGCNKIVGNTPGPGDKHGCPFKHMNHEELKKNLEKSGIPASGISDILSLTRENNYTLACTKCFEITHKQFPENPIIHPNSYFAQSREILSKVLGGKENSHANEKNSQKIKNERISTPGRGNITPGRGNATPGRNIGTPTSKKFKTKMEPVNIEEMLNSDDFDEVMAEI